MKNRDAWFNTQAGKDYKIFNETTSKTNLTRFLPSGEICKKLDTLGKTGQWNDKGKSYTVLSEGNERKKKAIRAGLCYSKRKYAIGILVAVALTAVGLIIMLSSYFSAWQNFDEIFNQWIAGIFFLLGGFSLLIILFLMWRLDDKSIKENIKN